LVIRFGFPVDVHRPVEEVFAYLTDPRNLPEWQQTDRVEQLTPGPLSTGTRLYEARTVLGRRLASTSEVTELQPGRSFNVRIASPYAHVTDRWTFEAVSQGTRLHFSTEGRARPAFRPIERVIAVVLERRRRGHHARLKHVLEFRGVSAA
jgi:uncharacterized protein YndB with AHSA1/START domain